MDMKTHIITHPDNNKKRYEFTPVVSPTTRIRIRSYGFAEEGNLDSLMQISIARAFWKGKVSEGWNVEKEINGTHTDDTKKKEKEWLDKFIDQQMRPASENQTAVDIGTQLHEAIQKKKSIHGYTSEIEKEIYSLYMKNKKKHDDDFFKNNYAMEA